MDDRYDFEAPREEELPFEESRAWADDWQPHSGLGIASFIVALVMGLSMVALFIVAGALAIRSRGAIKEDQPVMFAIGAGMMLIAPGALMGGALGLAGAFQVRRQKVFAILGLCLNGMIVFAFVGLVIIGILNQHGRLHGP